MDTYERSLRAWLTRRTDSRGDPLATYRDDAHAIRLYQSKLRDIERERVRPGSTLVFTTATQIQAVTESKPQPIRRESVHLRPDPYAHERAPLPKKEQEYLVRWLATRITMHGDILPEYSLQQAIIARRILLARDTYHLMLLSARHRKGTVSYVPVRWRSKRGTSKSRSISR